MNLPPHPVPLHTKLEKSLTATKVLKSCHFLVSNADLASLSQITSELAALLITLTASHFSPQKLTSKDGSEWHFLFPE